jgi:hypothetical protein
LVGGEHHAEGRQRHIEAVVGKRQRFGVGGLERHGQTLRGCAFLAALQQFADIIGRGHLREVARCRQRRVAVAGSDVEHALAGAQIDRLAEALADDLQGGADHGVVAGGPSRLLALLDGGVVGLGGRDGLEGIEHGFILCWV